MFLLWYSLESLSHVVCVHVCCVESFTSSPADRGRWELCLGRSWEQQWCIPLDPDGSSSFPTAADSRPSGTDEDKKGARWRDVDLEQGERLREDKSNLLIGYKKLYFEKSSLTCMCLILAFKPY